MSQSTASLHQQQIVDDAVLAYVEWREECTEVWDAYARWTNADAVDKPFAHAAYCAALDREQAAAIVYSERLGRVSKSIKLDSEHPLTPRGSF